MNILSAIKSIFCWRNEIKQSPYNMKIVEETHRQLQAAVKETSEASNKLIAKLESKVDSLEDELSERECLLSELFATIPDFLCLKDHEGRWKLLNAYGKNLYGIHGTDYKNKSDFEIAELYPKFKLSLQKCIDTDELAWEMGSAYQYEERLIDIAGKEYIFDVTKTPIYHTDGRKKHLLVHGKNVTEELENTKHIRMLLNALNKASDSITVTDHEFKIIYANEAFCNIYGYALDEVIDKKRSFVKSGKTPNKTYKDMYEHINNAQSWSGEMINKTKSGDLIKEHVTITPILNGKPYPIYFIGVNRLIK